MKSFASTGHCLTLSLGLGAKATQFILSSSDPLTTLVKLSQNFPKYASALAESPIAVSDSLTAELQQNRQVLEAGFNAVWLNGLQLTEGQMEPFALLKLIRAESKRIDQLKELGLTTKQAVDVISYPAMSDAMSASTSSPGSVDSLGPLFDASDRQENGEAILWWNNLEEDKRYARWSSSLNAVGWLAGVNYAKS